jgi:hypothetical protein
MVKFANCLPQVLLFLFLLSSRRLSSRNILLASYV